MKQSTSSVLNEVFSLLRKQSERDYFIFHHYRYQYILDRIRALNLPDKAKLLDVGCYPPHLYDALSTLGYDVYGVSSVHEPIKKRHIIVCNVEKEELPYEEGFFDGIIFTEVMEHLVIDPDIYLSKMKKVLKKNGVLLITTPNAAGLHKLIPLVLGKSTYFPLEQLYATRYDDGSLYHRHNREYAKDELDQILRRSGFNASIDFVQAYHSYERAEVQGNLLRMAVRVMTHQITRAIPRFRDSLSALAIIH